MVRNRNSSGSQRAKMKRRQRESGAATVTRVKQMGIAGLMACFVLISGQTRARIHMRFAGEHGNGMEYCKLSARRK